MSCTFHTRLLKTEDETVFWIEQEEESIVLTLNFLYYYSENKFSAWIRLSHMDLSSFKEWVKCWCKGMYAYDINIYLEVIHIDNSKGNRNWLSHINIDLTWYHRHATKEKSTRNKRMRRITNNTFAIKVIIGWFAARPWTSWRVNRHVFPLFCCGGNDISFVLVRAMQGMQCWQLSAKQISFLAETLTFKTFFYSRCVSGSNILQAIHCFTC